MTIRRRMLLESNLFWIIFWKKKSFEFGHQLWAPRVRLCHIRNTQMASYINVSKMGYNNMTERPLRTYDGARLEWVRQWRAKIECRYSSRSKIIAECLWICRTNIFFNYSISNQRSIIANVPLCIFVYELTGWP